MIRFLWLWFAKKIKPQQLNNNLKHLSPLKEIKLNQDKNAQYHQRIEHSIAQLMNKKKSDFVHNIDQLQLVSPLATISRGYSVTRSEQGSIIKNLGEMAIGDKISIQITDGLINAKVLKCEAKTRKNN